MDNKELNGVLKPHKMWLSNEDGEVKANLRGTKLPKVRTKYMKNNMRYSLLTAGLELDVKITSQKNRKILPKKKLEKWTAKELLNSTLVF